MDLFEAIVVSINHSGRVVLQTMDSDQLHFVIAKNAKNLVKPKCANFFFGAAVKVHLIQSQLDGFKNSPFEPEFVGSVVQFSFDDIPAEASSEWNSQIVAVIENEPEYIGIAGFSKNQKHFAINSDPNVTSEKLSFASGYPMRLKPFYNLTPVGVCGCLWMTKDEEAAQNYTYLLQMSFLNEASSSPLPPLGVLTYYNLKSLNEKEAMKGSPRTPSRVVRTFPAKPARSVRQFDRHEPLSPRNIAISGTEEYNETPQSRQRNGKRKYSDSSTFNRVEPPLTRDTKSEDVIPEDPVPTIEEQSTVDGYEAVEPVMNTPKRIKIEVSSTVESEPTPCPSTPKSRWTPLVTLKLFDQGAAETPRTPIRAKLEDSSVLYSARRRVIFVPTLEQATATVGVSPNWFVMKEDGRFEDKLACAQTNYTVDQTKRVFGKQNKNTVCACFKVPCSYDMDKENSNSFAKQPNMKSTKFVEKQFDALFYNESEPIRWNTEPMEEGPSINHILPVLHH